MIYNLIIYMYLLGVAFYSRFNEKVRKMWRGERDAFRVLREQVDPTAQYVWFHAASLGEFEQGRPLMERLRREHPEYKILLTFFSPSGYEVRKNYEGADIICYLPLDTITNARRFLRAIRPVMAFFIKYEFWYNYLHILKHRNVPVYSVSSIFRPDQVFFKWYGRQYGRVLNCFTHFFVQNEVSRELLAKIGITNVSIVGDTRFDRVLQVKEAPLSSPVGETIAAFLNGGTHEAPLGAERLRVGELCSGARRSATLSLQRMGGTPRVFVAGSSWPPDEAIFIRYFKEHPGWKLIIAPHVIGEDHLQQIEKQLEGWNVVRYTRRLSPPPLPCREGSIYSQAENTVEELTTPLPIREGPGESLLAIAPYDLYGEFGCCLGTDPTIDDKELRELTVAIVPLAGGEFYHFGTSREMISSTLAVQNLVGDQRRIMHHDRKPHPSIFVQNAITKIKFTEQNANIWIENSYIGEHWQLTHDNIVTGVPRNDWHITLQPGECIDVVPIGETQYCLRRYHIDDRFAGEEQQKKQFPIEKTLPHPLPCREGSIYSQAENTVEKLTTPLPTRAGPGESLESLLSAEDISNQANLRRLVAQREAFQRENLPALASNWEHSVFYQLDLADVAQRFKEGGMTLPPPVPADAPLLTRISDAMLRNDSNQAFSLLREGLTETVLSEKQLPRKSVYDDQIVWGRSPVRIDLAGGWTDTPPYCLMEGGTVINIAIELNGQPPLQTYIKPCREPHIVLRSIDLGAMEVIETYEQLALYNKVGSPFSIPKAALVLAGFQPGFSQERFPSLRSQLEAFGCGIELTLLSAIPAGSGLGTSSILASTVLGAVSDFCALAWDKNEIGRRTLILEQLLTTGGGWQDQFGGVLGGVKLLQTQSGFDQSPIVRWLPDHIFTQPEYQACHLLYYTGITRTAKHILAEIVRRMFLNHHDQLLQLRQMKEHTMEMYEAIQRQDFRQTGRLIRRTWQQNQQIDSGTNPLPIEQLTRLIDNYCLGYKLPGAGGGGYLYMVAKDPEAAARIKQTLANNRPNANARFVDMTLSGSGLQISRS